MRVFNFKNSIFIFAVILSGCGGGSGGDTSGGSGHSGEVINMVKNELYTVYPGDRIEKSADNTEVWISHQKDHADSQVKLLSGSANLIRH